MTDRDEGRSPVAVDRVAATMERRVRQARITSGIALAIAIMFLCAVTVPVVAQAAGVAPLWEVGALGWVLLGLSLLAFLVGAFLRAQVVGAGPLRIFDEEMVKAAEMSRGDRVEKP